MNLADLDLDNTVEFIKSHSCSGRMERKFAEQLCSEFQSYQDLLTFVFEVADISFVNVWKQKFGFLEFESDVVNNFLTHEKYNGVLNSDKLTFIYHVCESNGFNFMITSWDNSDHKLLYPRCHLYLRKKEDPNLLF